MGRTKSRYVIDRERCIEDEGCFNEAIRGVVERLRRIVADRYPHMPGSLKVKVPEQFVEIYIFFKKPLNGISVVANDYLNNVVNVTLNERFSVSYVRLGVFYNNIYSLSFFDSAGEKVLRLDSRFSDTDIVSNLFALWLSGIYDNAEIRSTKRTGAEWLEELLMSAEEVRDADVYKRLDVKELLSEDKVQELIVDIYPSNSEVNMLRAHLWSSSNRFSDNTWATLTFELADGLKSSTVRVNINGAKTKVETTHTWNLTDEKTRELFLTTLSEKTLEKIEKTITTFLEAYKLANITLRYMQTYS